MPYIDKINVGGTDYDIGGGGHAIEDASGTVLTQRDTLQVAGTLKASDDSTNEKTVISDAAEEVEWSVWNEMTEAERDEYSAGKKLDIVNVPGADGTIDADLMDLLWTNPSPDVAFSAQTIALDLSEYVSVKIVFRRAISENYWFTFDFEKGSTASVACVLWNQNSNETVRLIGAISDSGVVFGTGKSPSATDDNGYMVPLKIYGIKKTINLKINAIASNVSTSASKCMLSDGETSVEDVVTELADDTGWQQLTSNIAYRKKGGVVYLNLFSGVTSTSTWSLLATLPSGYAPVANTTFTLYCNFTNNQFGNILIDASGNIYGLGNANVQNATISYIPA